MKMTKLHVAALSIATQEVQKGPFTNEGYKIPVCNQVTPFTNERCSYHPISEQAMRVPCV
jgi:hypothetical protein